MAILPDRLFGRMRILEERQPSWGDVADTQPAVRPQGPVVSSRPISPEERAQLRWGMHTRVREMAAWVFFLRTQIEDYIRAYPGEQLMWLGALRSAAELEQACRTRLVMLEQPAQRQEGR